ncbi:MAG TPA: hypothetical protein VM346_02575 [Sphingomicrobium sp.]|nr:hypothetical protein [Sphingomicrobium sp.]
MTGTATNDARSIRPLAWGGTAALVLLPLLAIKAIDPAAWELADLPFALIMIAAVGIAFELAIRLPSRWAWRAGAAGALATAFLLTWGNLAVGFAGSEDNEINIILFAVPLVALAGSALAGFRASGIALALAAAAAAQMVVGLVLLFAGFFTGPLTVAFTGLWLASAWLFRRAAREPPRPLARRGRA